MALSWVVSPPPPPHPSAKPMHATAIARRIMAIFIWQAPSRIQPGPAPGARSLRDAYCTRLKVIVATGAPGLNGGAALRATASGGGRNQVRGRAGRVTG